MSSAGEAAPVQATTSLRMPSAIVSARSASKNGQPNRDGQHRGSRVNRSVIEVPYRLARDSRARRGRSPTAILARESPDRQRRQTGGPGKRIRNAQFNIRLRV
jgi:hypothetical protein